MNFYRWNQNFFQGNMKKKNKITVKTKKIAQLRTYIQNKTI